MEIFKYYDDSTDNDDGNNRVYEHNTKREEIKKNDKNERKSKICSLFTLYNGMTLPMFNVHTQTNLI